MAVQSNDLQVALRRFLPEVQVLPTAERLLEFAGALLQWDKVHQITAIKTQASVIKTLICPSLVLLEYCQAHWPGRLHGLDLGSGGGVPGLILALVDPEVTLTLVEKSQKKASFLRLMKAKFNLTNVSVIAKDFTGLVVDPSVDVIMTRGVATLRAQLAMTEDWRQAGVPLLSVQTEASLKAAGDLGVAVDVCMNLDNENQCHLVRVS